VIRVNQVLCSLKDTILELETNGVESQQFGFRHANRDVLIPLDDAIQLVRMYSLLNQEKREQLMEMLEKATS
jgi:hypothetical protein